VSYRSTYRELYGQTRDRAHNTAYKRANKLILRVGLRVIRLVRLVFGFTLADRACPRPSRATLRPSVAVTVWLGVAFLSLSLALRAGSWTEEGAPLLRLNHFSGYCTVPTVLVAVCALPTSLSSLVLPSTCSSSSSSSFTYAPSTTLHHSTLDLLTQVVHLFPPRPLALYPQYIRGSAQ